LDVGTGRKHGDHSSVLNQKFVISEFCTLHFAGLGATCDGFCH
jgi:hypothetical protein